MTEAEARKDEREKIAKYVAAQARATGGSLAIGALGLLTNQAGEGMLQKLARLILEGDYLRDR